MGLNEYFDFLAPDDIRIKGHRIGIETVLYEYLYRERTPEAKPVSKQECGCCESGHFLHKLQAYSESP